MLSVNVTPELLSLIRPQQIFARIKSSIRFNDYSKFYTWDLRAYQCLSEAISADFPYFSLGFQQKYNYSANNYSVYLFLVSVFVSWCERTTSFTASTSITIINTGMEIYPLPITISLNCKNRVQIQKKNYLKFDSHSLIGVHLWYIYRERTWTWKR